MRTLSAHPSPSESITGIAYAALGTVHLATGDASAAWEAYEAARERTAMDPMTASMYTLGAACPAGMRRSRRCPPMGR